MGIRVLGVMTGTSCDGLDAACMDFESETNWRYLWGASLEYPKSLRNRVLQFQKPGIKAPIQNWLELDRDLGLWYASAVDRILKRANKEYPSRAKVDLIANHGQTLAHFPQSSVTLQMGDPARIAFETGTTVASHFRNGDLAAGGQGAPMASLYHRSLAKRLGLLKKGVAIHNIGGISNWTYVSASQVFALDTGPGNIWIDAATEELTGGEKKYDSGGKLAAKYAPNEQSLKKLLKINYFSRKLPKTTGRDDFPYSLFQKETPKASRISTATHLTARTIVDSYQRYLLKKNLPLEKIILSGGGAQNKTLVSLIRKDLHPVSVVTMEDIGFESQFVEAQAFALLGYLTLRGQALGGPWTQAQTNAPSAQLTPSKNWNSLMKKIR